MTFERDHERNRHSNANDIDEITRPGRSSRSAGLTSSASPTSSGLLMRKARDANGVAEGAEQAVAIASTGGGSSLPIGIMRKFEESLGTDLSSVRVHTGGPSQHAAESVGARAYTIGQDIHFGANHYDPSSAAGEHLLAHEVAHTVQQRGGSPTRMNKLEVSAPTDSFEHEADRAADAMIRGAVATVGSGSGVSRRTLWRGTDKSLNKTAAEANEASHAENDKGWNYGSDDLYDKEGELKHSRVGKNLDKRGDEKTNADIRALLLELDRLKPLIERWKGVGAEIKAMAGSGGINVDAPDSYREGILAIAKARDHDGSTTSNDSIASDKLHKLWGGTELVEYQAAVAEATGAGEALGACHLDLDVAKNRLQSATLDEEIKKDQGKVAAINAKVALIAGTVGLVTKLGGNLTAGISAGVMSATPTPNDQTKAGLGKTGAALGAAGNLGDPLQAAIRALGYQKDLDALGAKISSLDASIKALNLANLNIDLSKAMTNISAATAKFTAFGNKVKALEAAFQQRMQALGRTFDRKDVNDSTAAGKAALAKDGTSVAKGQKVSMEAVMGVFAALQRRGVARGAAKDMVAQCPTAARANAIADAALKRDPMSPLSVSQPRLDDADNKDSPVGKNPQLNSDAQEDRAGAAPLRAAAANAAKALEELKTGDAGEAALEAKWAQMVTTAMGGV